jgi:hypothetical protein
MNRDNEETHSWTTQYSDWLRAGRPRGRSSSPGRIKNFPFSKLSRPALGPTQPPIQWEPGVLSPGVKWQERDADANLQLVLRSRKRRSIDPVPHMSSWHSS